MKRQFYKAWILSASFIISMSLVYPTLLAEVQTKTSPPGKSITTENSEIEVDELELHLKPPTRDELEIEVKGWLALLKVVVEELSNTEVAIKQKREEIDAA